jgi:hypothetical protein
LGASALLKMSSGMLFGKGLAGWCEKNLNPEVEMFFAPSIVSKLVNKWGAEKLADESDKVDIFSTMLPLYKQN